jgi:hypothetical protein
MNQGSLTTALGIAASAIATEHFFTFSLSSLPTTKEFFSGTEEGKAEVRHAYIIATILSIGLALLICYYLKSVIPLVVTLTLAGIFIFLYERALRGEV